MNKKAEIKRQLKLVDAYINRHYAMLKQLAKE